MKRLMTVLLVLFTLLTLSACEPQVYSGKLILEGQHTLASVDGDLVILSGRITLPVGSHVTGSVYLLGGELQADGAIGGSVSIMTGTLTLGPHARVQGDLKIGAGQLRRAPQAVIGGQVTSETGIAVPLSPAWWNDQSVGAQLLWFLARTVPLAVLAFLLTRFAPRPIARVGRAATRHAVISGAMGLLTLVVGLVLLVFMAFTIVLLPITLLGLLSLGAAIVYGWTALGLEVGRRLANLLKRTVALPAAAFLGTLALMVALFVIGYLPYAGSVVLVISAAVGLGAALLTHLGRRSYAPATEELPPGEKKPLESPAASAVS